MSRNHFRNSRIIRSEIRSTGAIFAVFVIFNVSILVGIIQTGLRPQRR